MTKIAWIVAGVAIITGLGAAFVVLTPGVEDAHAQEMAPPPPQRELKPAPPTPIAKQKAELGDDRTWNPAWDLFIEEALPSEMLSPRVARAVKPFCPGFNRLSDADKRVFWAYFFQALAGAEAGLVPTANVRHMDPELQVRDDVTQSHKKPGVLCGAKVGRRCLDGFADGYCADFAATRRSSNQDRMLRTGRSGTRIATHAFARVTYKRLG